MFGHTHKDEIKIFYDLDNLTRPINVAYIAPSVTTQSFLNPGYRVYTVDGYYKDSSYQVIDTKTVFLNLTEANEFNVTKWREEYSAKKAFNMKNLFPQDWSELVDLITSNLDGPLANMVYKFYSKSSDAFLECDENCRKSLFCGFKQAKSEYFIPC